MDAKLIETLGDELYHAMTTQSVVEPLTSRHPDITIENAYHIQQRMLSRRLQAGECKHGADGDATAGGVEVQFVALPTDLVSLRIFLCARGASRVELKEHLLKRLAALALQWAWFGRWANLAFWWTPGFVLWLGWGHFGLVLFCNRLPCLYGRGVAADVSDELATQGVLDHARVHTLDQLAGGKFAKGPAEGGLAWQCMA